MAKRKRLAPADPMGQTSPEAETVNKAGASPPRRSAPIAEVAGDAAVRAALEEVSAELSAARTEGRLIVRIAIDDINVSHLLRDRMGLDQEDMEALKASLVARGQQVPIEVMQTSSERYGLISGWRRIEALRQLGHTHVVALIRTPQNSGEAYQAMIEENEIRAGLSFYERARLAYEAVGIGVFPTSKQAVAGLFAAASSAKRSKISKFVKIHQELGAHLRFPTAIPEKLGLTLSSALEADKGLAGRLRDRLRQNPAPDAATERRRIEQAMRGQGKTRSAGAGKGDEVAPGLFLHASKGKVVLTGSGLSGVFLDELKDWLARRGD